MIRPIENINPVRKIESITGFVVEKKFMLRFSFTFGDTKTQSSSNTGLLVYLTDEEASVITNESNFGIRLDAYTDTDAKGDFKKIDNINYGTRCIYKLFN